WSESQVPFVQDCVWQSAATLQVAPTAHGGQLPPQSMAVSSPSMTWLLHVDDTTSSGGASSPTSIVVPRSFFASTFTSFAWPASAPVDPPPQPTRQTQPTSTTLEAQVPMRGVRSSGEPPSLSTGWGARTKSY